MNNLLSKLNWKIGMSTAALALLAMTAVLGLAPRKVSHTKAEGCSILYSQPVFNPYPVTWADTAGYDCTDFAVLSGNVQGAGFWADSFTAQPGDLVSMRIYVHNGAASNSGAVMHGVNVDTDFDRSSGTSHLVTTTLSASNAASKSGSVTINTPSGTHLELVSGDSNFYIGDMEPCFEYARIYRFTLKVVADTVTPPVIQPEVTGQISTSLGICKANDLYNANVSWSTNAAQPLVTVSDPDLNSDNYYDNDKIFSYSAQSNETVDWLSPNKGYRFSLWSIDPNGENHSFRDISNNRISVKATRLYESWVSAGPSCGQPQPQPVVTGQINTSLDICKANGMYNANVSWTSGAGNVVVTVSDPNLNSDNYYDNDKIFSYSAQSNETVDWIAPNTGYRFTLWAMDPSGQSHSFRDYNEARHSYTVKKLYESWVAGGDTCVNPPVMENVVCSVSPSVITAGQSATFSADKGSGRYSWTVSGGSVASSNQKTFSSTFSQAGTYAATVTSGNTQASCSVQVNAKPSICVANTNYAINAMAPVRSGSAYASTISWSSTGSNQIKIVKVSPNGSSETFFTGNNTGSKIADGLQAASTYIFRLYDAACDQYLTSVTVSTPAAPQTLVCAADSASYNINQTATFRASGGSGAYTWFNGGAPSTGSGAAFNTAFAAAGVKTVNVISGDGQTAQCSTVVNPAVVQKAVVNLTKQVKNLTSGDSAFTHSASAKQNDIVEYRIKVWAASSVALKNAVVTDSFASGLNYIDGSLKVNGQPHAAGLTGSGLTFNSISQTPVVITYQAKVTVSVGSIINTAQARAENADNVATDQALVNVSYVAPGQPALSITKQVKNVTQNTAYSGSVSANKNDTVKYQVVIKNIGQAAANNVYFSDSNPVQVQPLASLSVSGSYSGSIASGVSLGNLAAGQSVTVTYQGTVQADGGTIVNVATVSSDNAASQNASASVVISTSGGGGNYNYCVNYSCNATNTYNNYNYVYINNAGGVVPYSQYSQLSISKSVRLLSGGAFQNSVNASANDTVEFEIVITAGGSQSVNSVRLTDSLPSGLGLVGGSVRVDGSYVSDGNLYSGMYLGSLSSGQQKRVVFQARVNTGSNSSIQNIASVSGGNTSSAQDDAWVFVGGVAGGNVSLAYSKSAVNETKNADATAVAASREDYITYTLKVSNNGNTPADNFVITDDLSQVLPYADIVDNGGGTVSGNTISFPGLSVPAYGYVTRSFKVRVKYTLQANLSYVMTNTYGNTLSIRINNPQVQGAYIAPKTGAETGAFAFSGILTAAAALFRRRKEIFKLIFT